ncbi:MAG: aldehyde dehydrogenase family protein [Pseudomonadota bacterium]
MNVQEKIMADIKSVFPDRYENSIGGEWRPPTSGRYFTNTSPINGAEIGEIARSDHQDVELALDAAHKAADAWDRTSATDRATMLLKVAQRMEENLKDLALAETVDNGKPIREAMAVVLRTKHLDVSSREWML